MTAPRNAQAKRQYSARLLPKLEVQLVHESADTSSVVTVVGIMLKELTPKLDAAGETASHILQFFKDFMPKVTLPHTRDPT